MKKTTLLIVILVLCLFALLFMRGWDTTATTTKTAPAAAVNGFSHWKVLDDQTLEYSAQFPAEIKSISKSTPDPKTKINRNYKFFASEALDATAYLITEIQFPKDYNPSSDPTLLETIVNELVANGPTNTLKESENVQFRGDEALKFKIENDQKQVVMGLAFIHGQSVFILQRVSKEDKINQKEFDYFADSFKFKAPAKAK